MGMKRGCSAGVASPESYSGRLSRGGGYSRCSGLDPGDLILEGLGAISLMWSRWIQSE